MIITNSSIGMDSARTYTSVSMDAFTYKHSVSTLSLNEARGLNGEQASGKNFVESLSSAINTSNSSDADEEEDEKVKKKEKDNRENADTLSGNAENSLDYLNGKFNKILTSKSEGVKNADVSQRTSVRFMLLNYLLMLLFGRDFLEKYGFNQLGMGDSIESFGDIGGSLQFQRVTDTMSFEHYEAEHEETTFSAKGVVKTADGNEIDINIDVAMSRSFEKYTKASGVMDTIRMTFCDPLVINLDSCDADISDQKFYFDLDADGVQDKISKLSAGSGFLALDLNEDGEINDGSELFGTKSGDGFKDLAQYDKDGNGWIDEADEVFDKLKVYCFNEDGTTSLYKLKDKGVGAIYLGNRDTEFSVTNQENKVNALVRKTGVFLYESGAAGTIQHVDLAVELGA